MGYHRSVKGLMSNAHDLLKDGVGLGESVQGKILCVGGVGRSSKVLARSSGMVTSTRRTSRGHLITVDGVGGYTT